MAASHFPTSLFPSANLTESAGGIVFSRTLPRRICILFHTARQQFLLAKGRRDHSESRGSCALREVREEAGLRSVAFLPVTLPTRATPPSAENSDPNIPDEVRHFAESTDPFMCVVRNLGDSPGERDSVKLIWWFVMQADQGEGDGLTGEEGWERRWTTVEEAQRMLSFADDRQIVRAAIDLVAKKDQQVLGDATKAGL